MFMGLIPARKTAPRSQRYDAQILQGGAEGGASVFLGCAASFAVGFFRDNCYLQVN